MVLFRDTGDGCRICGLGLWWNPSAHKECNNGHVFHPDTNALVACLNEKDWQSQRMMDRIFEVMLGGDAL